MGVCCAAVECEALCALSVIYPHYILTMINMGSLLGDDVSRTQLSWGCITPKSSGKTHYSVKATKQNNTEF